jgi:hypothetical protein
MLPDLLACTNFVQFRLEESLLRCWLKLPRARDHTDLYVFQRESKTAPAGCSLWTHAPDRSRPWGIELPVVSCVCLCSVIKGSPSFWIMKYHRTTLVQGETYYFFATSCCAFELHIAIYVATLRVRACHGTQVVFAKMDSDGNKVFDYDTMVMMRLQVCLMTQSLLRFGSLTLCTCTLAKVRPC